MERLEKVYSQIRLFHRASAEQSIVVKEFWAEAEELLNAENVNGLFYVRVSRMPEELLTFRRNFFSILFISMFHLLGISSERLKLYAFINHLFRCWVTSADNLLDNEDKITIAFDMPGDSPVMRQVIAIMLSDRLLFQKLNNCVERGVLTAEEAGLLSSETLRILLPAAAEEGTEEGGLKIWPSAEEVLTEIHPVKTGLLFHIPFTGPECIEKDIDMELLAELKDGLMKFGVACQLLDDVKDFETDFRERRANFLISRINEQVADADGKIASVLSAGDGKRLAACSFGNVVDETVMISMNYFNAAFTTLDHAGLKGFRPLKKVIIKLLLSQLGVKELKNIVEKYL